MRNKPENVGDFYIEAINDVNKTVSIWIRISSIQNIYANVVFFNAKVIHIEGFITDIDRNSERYNFILRTISPYIRTIATYDQSLVGRYFPACNNSQTVTTLCKLL